MKVWDILKRPTVRRVSAAAALAVVLYALFGFLLLPRLVLPVLVRRLSGTLHRDVTIRALSLNPFTLAATVEGVKVAEKGGKGTFLSLERLHVNLEAVSLLKGGPVVREVRLVSPYVSIVRDLDLSYNFSDLLAASGSEPRKKPLQFSINNIRVEGGSLDFDDRPQKTRHQVRGLALGIPFLSDIPSQVEIFTHPFLEAKVNGAPVSLRGETKPFSGTHETSIEIDLKDVDLPFYLAYVPADNPAQLAGGRLDAKLAVSFHQSPRGETVLVVSGAASLRGATVLVGKRRLLALERLDAVLDSYDVFGGVARLRSLVAVAPAVDVRRDETGAFEAAALFGSGTRKEGKPSFRVEAKEIRIRNGSLSYRDLSPGRPFETALDGIEITVTDFSNSPGRSAKLTASARSRAGETLAHTGAFTVEPFAAEGDLKLTGIALKRYAAFYEKNVLFDIDGGTLDLSTHYRWASDRPTTLTGLAATLASARFRKRGESEPFLKVPLATLTETEVDLGKRAIVLGGLESANGSIAVIREPDGSSDLEKLVVPEEAAQASPLPTPWRWRVGRLSLDRWRAAVEDRAVRKVAHLVLVPTSLTLRNLSNEPKTRGELALRFGLNGKGLASARGPLGLEPLFASLQVEAREVPLPPLEPYVVGDLRLAVAEGSLSGRGTLSFRRGADSKVGVSFAGNSVASRVATRDEATREDVVSWETLTLQGLEAGYNPVSLKLATLALTRPVLHVAVAPDGGINLLRVMGTKGPFGETAEDTGAAPAPAATPPPSPQAPAAPMPPVRIDVIAIEGGTIRLADSSVRPSFAAALVNVGGRITGLSSNEGTKAEVDLSAKLEGGGPFEIKGTINPLAATSHADVTASVRDVDLPPFSPYFGKYAGYRVGKGKLTLDLKYIVNNRSLNAKNRLLVDQFEFGEKVVSPDATKLPVKLAVALLRDRNGLIDLDVPVSGSLDDPKFKVGRIVLKVLGNLIVKAATSPFALLGSLFGGGQDLSRVEFEPGSERLTSAATSRLEGLSKALQDRPALKLEVAGRFDPEKDAEGLRRLLVERKVKAQKAEELARKGQRPAPPDELVVAPGERENYLRQAYRKESFKKPRNALGLQKDIPPAEMEKLMLANAAVGPDELKQLGLRRAQAVRDFFLAGGKVEPGRLFLVDPSPSAAGEKEPAPGSRVDFVLK